MLYLVSLCNAAFLPHLCLSCNLFNKVGICFSINWMLSTVCFEGAGYTAEELASGVMEFVNPKCFSLGGAFSHPDTFDGGFFCSSGLFRALKNLLQAPLDFKGLL